MQESNSLHLTHEVINNSAKAYSIAKAKSSQSRYKYKANALLMGYPKLEPYDPIYLHGLTEKMQGMWIVISIVHTINAGLPYTMSVHLGSNDELLALKPDNFTDILDTTNKVKAVIEPEPDTNFSKRAVKRTGEYVYRTTEFQITPINKEKTLINKTDQFYKFKSANKSTNGELAIIPDLTTHTPNLIKKKSVGQWIRE